MRWERREGTEAGVRPDYGVPVGWTKIKISPFGAKNSNEIVGQYSTTVPLYKVENGKQLSSVIKPNPTTHSPAVAKTLAIAWAKPLNGERMNSEIDIQHFYQRNLHGGRSTCFMLFFILHFHRVKNAWVRNFREEESSVVVATQQDNKKGVQKCTLRHGKAGWSESQSVENERWTDFAHFSKDGDDCFRFLMGDEKSNKCKM